MKIFRHPLFLFTCLVALTIYIAKLSNLTLPTWVHFYVNDFLCMPIIFSVCLAVMRYLKKDDNLYMPNSIILLITAYYSVHFEWLVPKFYERYSSDWVDVLLYIVGALLFSIFQKKLF